jgi:hypothetical protein
MNESSDIGRRRRRARRVRRSADQWASLIAAQADSRMSIVAFCRERGVAVSTFHAWRRRLSGTRAASSSSSSCGFVRLRSGDEPPADGDGGAVVVRFADGVEVHVDAGQLTEVLRCLREGASDTGRG